MLDITLLIGTYASVPYVHLQLESRRRFYPNLPCIVCDDCSHETKRLSALCSDYDVQFHSNPYHLGHSYGDWSFFLRGLSLCATSHLLKLSRRYIPFANIFDLLPDSGITIGHPAFTHLPHLRTECIALSVKDWKPVFPTIPNTKFVERHFT
jgi:hypothetical protein